MRGFFFFCAVPPVRGSGLRDGRQRLEPVPLAERHPSPLSASFSAKTAFPAKREQQRN